MLSSSTTRATAFDADVPEPIAMPRSASLIAIASLTPSPVIATVWPSRCSRCTIARFWSGVTRPKMLCSARAVPQLLVALQRARIDR